MKKIFLMVAFAGLLGSNVIAATKGDDKDKKAKKECTADKKKACAGEKKEACSMETKSCCKKKAANSEKATDEKATDKKS